MKTLVITLLTIFSISSFGASKRARKNPQQVSVVHLPTGELEFDVKKSCADHLEETCIISYKGIKIVISPNYDSAPQLARFVKDPLNQVSTLYNPQITSTSNIVGLNYRAAHEHAKKSWSVFGSLSSKIKNVNGVNQIFTQFAEIKRNSDKHQTLNIDQNDNVKVFNFLSTFTYKNQGSWFYPTAMAVSKIRVKYSGVEDIYTQQLESSWSFLEAVKNLKENFNELVSGGIRRTDRRHFIRLGQAIDTTLMVMDPKNTGTPVKPTTHSEVVEANRMIMVMGTVLEELFTDYWDIKANRPAITVIRSFVSQTRQLYNFNHGLAGPGSKAIAALTDVIELEMREIKLLIGMLDFDSAQLITINKIIRDSQRLQGAVKGRQGGDAAVKGEVAIFSTNWNSNEWQDLLEKLLKGGTDTHKLLQPKLRLLLMALESLSDFTGATLFIPDAETIEMRMN